MVLIYREIIRDELRFFKLKSYWIGLLNKERTEYVSSLIDQSFTQYMCVTAETGNASTLKSRLLTFI